MSPLGGVSALDGAARACSEGVSLHPGQLSSMLIDVLNARRSPSVLTDVIAALAEQAADTFTDPWWLLRALADREAPAVAAGTAAFSLLAAMPRVTTSDAAAVVHRLTVAASEQTGPGTAVPDGYTARRVAALYRSWSASADLGPGVLSLGPGQVAELASRIPGIEDCPPGWLRAELAALGWAPQG